MNEIKKLLLWMGAGRLKAAVKRMLIRGRGFQLLSPDDTNRILAPFLVREVQGQTVQLPEVRNEADGLSCVFKKTSVTSYPLYCWDYKCSNASVSRNGSVISQRQVFCTDREQDGFVQGFLKRGRRRSLFEPTAIALFSHPEDPRVYSGFYDYTFFIAAKLSRLKDAFAGNDLSRYPITYHAFGQPFEKEYMELLGFNPANFRDSRSCKITAQQFLLGNCCAPLPDITEIEVLKKHISLNTALPEITERKRIYIKRKGRRTIVNETELTDLLKQFNFCIIEDIPRSIREQIAIYRNASFILGPHGASFTNIIWCQPQTHLYELFSEGYAPNYFLYLAAVNNMNYHAYQDLSGKVTSNRGDVLYQDIYVAIPELEKSLRRILVDGY